MKRRSAASRRRCGIGRRIESELMFATSFPEHAGVGARADQGGRRAVRAERVRSGRSKCRSRSWSASRRSIASYQRTAATLLAHSLFDRGRYAEAEAAYVRVQGYLPANDPDRRRSRSASRRRSTSRPKPSRRRATRVGAVDDFLRVAALAPNAKVSANAEFDAASILMRDKQWDRAAQVLEGFRRNYPNHELQPEVTRSLAVAYLETGRAGEAAARVRAHRCARRGDRPTCAAKRCGRPRRCTRKPGRQPNAARAVRRLRASSFRRRSIRRQNARQKLADMAKAQNDVRGALAVDRRHHSSPTQSAGAARTDRSKYLAAKATLEDCRAAGRDVQFHQAGRAARQVAQGEAQRDGEGADRLRPGAGLRCRRGHDGCDLTAWPSCIASWAADLMTSERPKGLDADASEQYDVLLEEQAFPFEEKAIELHETNAQRTGDGVYDEWVQRSFDVLAEAQAGALCEGGDRVKTMCRRYAEAGSTRGYCARCCWRSRALRLVLAACARTPSSRCEAPSRQAPAARTCSAKSAGDREAAAGSRRLRRSKRRCRRSHAASSIRRRAHERRQSAAGGTGSSARWPRRIRRTQDRC